MEKDFSIMGSLISSMMAEKEITAKAIQSNKRGKFEGTEEQWYEVLLYCYKKRVLQRVSNFEETEEVKQNTTTVAKWMTHKNAKQGLLLSGGVGCGKTTMALTIIDAIKRYKNALPPKDRWRFANPVPLRAQDVVDMYKDSVKNELYRKCKILVIDDFGCDNAVINEFGTKKTPMVDLLCDRYINMNTTIITTNLDIEEIKEIYGERISDRLTEMCNKLVYKNKSFRK